MKKIALPIVLCVMRACAFSAQAASIKQSMVKRIVLQ